ncbi:MAG TPA: ABC transporter permease [Longimicrobium sp.]|jgi:putative ABC transport system permease protein
MTAWARVVRARLYGLLRKGRIEREMDEEMRFHIRMRAEENVRRGMAPEEARRAAERSFGNLARIKDAARDVRGGGLPETLLQDLRYGARTLRRAPAFALTVVLTSALAIGANTAIFSVVDAVLLRPLPFEDPGRLARLWGGLADGTAERIPVSYPNFADYRSQARTLRNVAAYSPTSAVLRAPGGEPESVWGARASADLFPLLGVRPELGRAYSPEEDRPDGPPVVVLGHELWRRRFASDPGVVGRQVTLDDRSVTVVGVMPPGFRFPVEGERSEYWVPVASDPGSAERLPNRRGKYLLVIARLGPGVGLERARAEIETIGRRLEAQYPDANTGWRFRLVPLREDVVGGARPALLVLLGAVGLVLLISCANVANLLLARAAARADEIAVRRALGASRARIVRQLLTESLLLSLAGGALGLLLAGWLVRAIARAGPADVPRLADAGLNAPVLGFALALSVVTGIVFGLAPALQGSRGSPGGSLKEGGRGATDGVRRTRLRGVLVASEAALSLMLLAGAGLLAKSFARLLQTEPGYETGRVLTSRVSLSEARHPEPARQAAVFRQVLRRVEAVPGVEAVGAARFLPLGGRDSYDVFRVVGRAPFAPGAEPVVRYQVASPGYFRAMGIPLLRGRPFTDGDAEGSPPVLVVNQAFARRHLPGEDPLGRRVAIGDQPPREIVGVVGDVRHRGLDEEAQPEFYVPYLQAPRPELHLVVRAAAADPARLAPAVRRAVREVAPDALVHETRTMDALLGRSVARRRFHTLLLGSFALTALVLATLGIYGVTAYTVTQRTHEIGIRVALGARRGDVLRLVVGRGMAPALAGIALGLAGALAATRVMAGLLYGVGPGDPPVFAGVSLLLAATALAACYLPARRATGVDPAVALRQG